MFHRSAAVALLLALAGLTGCSTDAQLVRSTTAAPLSAAVLDTTDQSTLWSMDVPPGHTLVLNANAKGDVTSLKLADAAPTVMTWKLFTSNESDRYFAKCPVDSGSVDVSGHPLIIDITRSAGKAKTSVLPTPTEPTPTAAVEQQMDAAADAAEPLPPEAPEAPEIETK